VTGSSDELGWVALIIISWWWNIIRWESVPPRPLLVQTTHALLL